MKTYAPSDGNCKIIEITEEDDFTTERGYEKTAEAIKTYKKAVLFISMPCTGGCMFNMGINWSKESAKAGIKGHWKLFRKLSIRISTRRSQHGSWGGRIENAWRRNTGLPQCLRSPGGGQPFSVASPPKTGPGRSQDSQKSTQESPKTPKNRPKTAPRRPKDGSWRKTAPTPKSRPNRESKRRPLGPISGPIWAPFWGPFSVLLGSDF